jgi:hypothetical protein
MEKTMETDEKKMSPIKAIRAKCLDCCCDQLGEVKLCPAKDCPLWPFRLGKNPNRVRNLTDEQKQAAKERLAKARAARKG